MAASPLRLDAFLPYRLSFTAGLLSDSIARTYQEEFGLSIPEWRVLAWVAESGGITQQEIGDRTRMDKVAVSRAAIAMTRRGLLDRRPHPQDRRSHLLALTPAGRALHAAIAPRALEFEARVFSRFSGEELDAFTAMLRQIDGLVLSLKD